MQTVNETLALLRETLSSAGNAGALAKAFTFSNPTTSTTGLQNYNLEPALRSFVPLFSPLRNRIPRPKATGSIQANWKAITGFDTNQQYSGIGEGQRGGLINQTTADYYAAFRTLGRENNVSFEAEMSAEGFDDLRSRAVMQLLNSTMVDEEKIILGGNSIHPIGQTPTPTCAASATGGTIASGVTVSVICVALTYDAYRRASGTITLVPQTVTRPNQDGSTSVINAGTGIPSANGTAITASATASVVAQIAPLRGAYGYAWYAGTVGAEKFYSVTNVSMVTITALPTSGTLQTAASLVAADYSCDTMIHDGLLGFIGNSALGSYYNPVTAGATLTPDGSGGIVEFDIALRYFWDTLRLSPSEILISSQEAVSIKKIITRQGAATSLSRFSFQMTANGMVGGALAKGYNNPFGTQQEIPITQHPYMVPGTVLMLTDTLPYPQNNVTNIMEVACQQDYWQTEWPLRTRAYEFGVYSRQVLKHYFPASMGVITNLSPAY